MSLPETIFVVFKPSNAILFLLLAGCLLLPAWHRGGVVLLVSGGLLLAALGGLPLGAAALRPLETRFAPAELAVAPDGIILLGGYLEATPGRAESAPALNEAGDRLTAAAVLAKRFADARIIVAGDPLGGNARSGAEITARFLETMGIDRARMILDARSRSTRDNAVFALQRVRPGGEERYLLVTSAFHMPRSIGTFLAAGWNRLLAYPVDRRTGDGDIWRSAAPDVARNLVLADRAAQEWSSLVLYRLRGWTRTLVPAPRLSSGAGGDPEP